jgi:dihydrofolate synthase/folylpolyglutamate synthase
MNLAQRLNQHHPKVIDLSLDRIKRLLKKLGNPQDNLPSIIHIAGTNGKGSTIAFMRAIAEAAGLNVHTYTSPHLVQFNERIRINGDIIHNQQLLRLIDEVEDKNGTNPITFFEITTAIAMLAFARTPSDLVLLETGLGGRLDATNVITNPIVTAITPISHDHAKFLGDKLEDIAAEKAAIMKPGTICFTTKQDITVLNILKNFAQGINVPLKIENKDWWTLEKKNQLSIILDETETKTPLPSLIGPHQIQNASLAIVALKALNEDRITEAAITKGLQNVKWPARMQKLTTGPLLEELPKCWELWLDGGHNPAAGKALALTLKTFDKQPIFLIVGMINSKKPSGFLKPLKRYIIGIKAVEIPNEKASLSAEQIVKIAKDIKLTASSATSVKEAVRQIVIETNVAGKILICGSLYLAGEVLKDNN